jgi:HAD superfamily hydrolase (TIGR01490 family)
MKHFCRYGAHVAAFFDIDGTLLAGPSLERRFFSALRRCGAISPKNQFLWLARAIRLAPRGLHTILHANKMYLRQVDVSQLSGADTLACTEARRVCANVRRSKTLRPQTRSASAVPFFFPAAINRAAWHAASGHSIVLVSGTLAPIAHQVAVALTLKLATRGVSASVGVCATRLEEIDGRWTGRIIGNAVFGEAKAAAIRRIALAEGFDLRRCYAYGDRSSDRWMLGAVGRAAAVNPSADLERTALLHDWPVLRWAPPVP